MKLHRPLMVTVLAALGLACWVASRPASIATQRPVVPLTTETPAVEDGAPAETIVLVSAEASSAESGPGAPLAWPPTDPAFIPQEQAPAAPAVGHASLANATPRSHLEDEQVLAPSAAETDDRLPFTVIE